MRDFVVDIQEPEFAFVLKDFTAPLGPLSVDDDTATNESLSPSVSEVSDYEEIMLLRAAAQEAMNGSR